MGCGSTGAALDRAADWSVLTTEDELWLAGLFPGRSLTPRSYRNSPGRRIAETT